MGLGDKEASPSFDRFCQKATAPCSEKPLARSLFLAVMFLVSPAYAEKRVSTNYPCEDGTSVAFNKGPKEVRVLHAVDGLSIAMPLAFISYTKDKRYAVWSPRTSTVGDCEIAPCMMYMEPLRGPKVLWYMLEQGNKVNCAAVRSK